MKDYTNGLSHRSYEGEIWHSIDIQPFDEIYEVSNFGRVRSHHNNRWSKIKDYKILKLQINGPGYPYIILHKDKQLKMVRIHRLVAEYFVPNPDNKPIVNHIDANKTNNYYKNLEWVTDQENRDHASKLGLLSNRSELQKEASRKSLAKARQRLKEIREERRMLREELLR